MTQPTAALEAETGEHKLISLWERYHLQHNYMWYSYNPTNIYSIRKYIHKLQFINNNTSAGRGNTVHVVNAHLTAAAAVWL